MTSHPCSGDNKINSHLQKLASCGHNAWEPIWNLHLQYYKSFLVNKEEKTSNNLIAFKWEPFVFPHTHSLIKEPKGTDTKWSVLCLHTQVIQFYPKFWSKNMSKLYHIFSWDVPDNCREGVISSANTGRTARDTHTFYYKQQAAGTETRRIYQTYEKMRLELIIPGIW